VIDIAQTVSFHLAKNQRKNRGFPELSKILDVCLLRNSLHSANFMPMKRTSILVQYKDLKLEDEASAVNRKTMGNALDNQGHATHVG
jgi:hypothetical protein